jgi:DTW domain-containing protein YfiP
MNEHEKKVVVKKDPRVHQKVNKNQACPNCYRDKTACICGKIQSYDNTLKVIILQHPQEQYKLISSARLSTLILKNSKLVVGLSWRSFKAIAGETEMPSQWGILYLKGRAGSKNPVEIINRKNEVTDAQTVGLRGIIALDGSWKQAKALWWRNPWFAKLNRITLNPDHPSIRNQSKEEGLSTIESVALALANLGEKSEIRELMVKQYETLILK